jgi:hypothetical protein
LSDVILGSSGFLNGAHALRAPPPPNALDRQANIAKAPEWLGHDNIATTHIYDRRRTRSEDSPDATDGAYHGSIG